MGLQSGEKKQVNTGFRSIIYLYTGAKGVKYQVESEKKKSLWKEKVKKEDRAIRIRWENCWTSYQQLQ